MKILITGGSGTLGVALLEKFQKQGHICTVYSRSEQKQSEIKTQFPDVRFMLGDVRDADWLEICMRRQDVVIHAAAYKMVPTAEVNAGEVVETNVIGSRNVVRAAIRAGVARVVGISTDKACAPVNTYGESKALMEKLFQQATLLGETMFTLVRYGNVAGSSGSVIPLFKAQIAAGKQLTITNPDMTRFWLTLDQAVDLVSRAMLADYGGVILVPKASASTMGVLARAVINKYGGKDAAFVTTGARPGEKLHECMVHSGESMHTYEKHGFFYIHPAYEINTRNFNLPPGFEYTSDKAPQFSIEHLMELV